MAIKHNISFWETGAGANSRRTHNGRGGRSGDGRQPRNSKCLTALGHPFRFLTATNHSSKHMKKNILKIFLAVVCFTALILAGAENPDGSCNIPWTLCWLSVCFITARGLKKLGVK